ncbi:DUF222 domain-containing protein, partial [Skermania piniformis]|uniref:DUF222 domain-containing protein n=1 Tax=Skermania pinensis TaxID=39122 RepID=UPI0039EAFE19
MRSSGEDSVTAAGTVAVIDAALDSLAVLLPDSGTAALGVLQALERVQRRVTGLGYRLIRVVAEAPGEEFGGQRSRDVLADALRITPKEASARLFESADLTEGLTMTGESVQAVLPATAGKVEAGVIGRDHVRVIRTFLRDLPSGVDYPTRVEAEKQLATVAVTVRPDQLRTVAVHLDAVLNPDGSLSDDRDRDRARKRGIRVGEQERDGMSRVTGYISPELRAYLETILAKYAAPGMCDPDDDTPAVDTAVRDGEVSDDRARRDRRTPTQRNHDALHAVLR